MIYSHVLAGSQAVLNCSRYDIVYYNFVQVIRLSLFLLFFPILFFYFQFYALWISGSGDERFRFLRRSSKRLTFSCRLLVGISLTQDTYVFDFHSWRHIMKYSAPRYVKATRAFILMSSRKEFTIYELHPSPLIHIMGCLLVNGHTLSLEDL